MSDTKNRHQKLFYHGAAYGMLAVLEFPEGMFQDDNPPFCVGNMLGQLCDRIYDAFLCPRYRAAVHLPVMKGGRAETVKFTVDVDVPKMRDADGMDRREAWEIPMGEYTDGTVKLSDYTGPVTWRSETWEKICIMLAPLDDAAAAPDQPGPEKGRGIKTSSADMDVSASYPAAYDEICAIVARNRISREDVEMDLDTRSNYPGEFYCLSLMGFSSEDLRAWLDRTAGPQA